MYWVVIVDDDKDTCEHNALILEKTGIKVTKLGSGVELLNYVEGLVPLPDLVLLDVIMPQMTGLETLEKLRQRPEPECSLPVIFLTGEDDLGTEKRALKLGAVDFIRKPAIPDILLLRVERMIEFERMKRDLTKEVAKRTRENISLTLHVVQTLAEAIDAKDTYTNGHSGRVAAYSKEIAKRYGYDESHQDEIYMMGLLHDVGKIGVPDWIINKTSRLTDEEFAEIKKHPVVGNKILKNIKEMPNLSFGARWHHERIDGRGYPDGLKGNEIPEEARIIAVADAYDAMTSNRSYRDLMPREKVREQIVNGKGTQFDERFADIMLEMIDEDTEYTMREGTQKEADLRERSSEEAIMHMDKNPVLPDKLLELEHIDTDLGLFMCGEIEDYLDALAIFADSISLKSEKIENALNSEDIENYTALVHSLKSSARTIGASGVSELARALELAGKNEDLDTIRSETPKLLNIYRALEEPLKNL
jgi:putative two-component system response regulator